MEDVINMAESVPRIRPPLSPAHKVQLLQHYDSQFQCRVCYLLQPLQCSLLPVAVRPPSSSPFHSASRTPRWRRTPFSPLTKAPQNSHYSTKLLPHSYICHSHSTLDLPLQYFPMLFIHTKIHLKTSQISSCVSNSSRTIYYNRYPRYNCIWSRRNKHSTNLRFIDEGRWEDIQRCQRFPLIYFLWICSGCVSSKILITYMYIYVYLCLI